MKSTEMDIVAVERISQYVNNKQEAAWLTPSDENQRADWPRGGSIAIKNYSMRYRP